MATSAAIDPKVTVQDTLSPVLSLFKLLGGTQTTANAGDTSQLNAVMGKLNALDPAAQLQALFQQAAGQIPGLQTGMANAIGARSGDNSAVAAALQKLLMQTTLAGQQQIATQQMQALQTQAQVAGNLSQATKGTKTKESLNLNQSAAILAALASLKKAGMLPESVDKMLGSDKVATNTQQPQQVPQQSVANVMPDGSMAMQSVPVGGAGGLSDWLAQSIMDANTMGPTTANQNTTADDIAATYQQPAVDDKALNDLYGYIGKDYQDQGF